MMFKMIIQALYYIKRNVLFSARALTLRLRGVELGKRFKQYGKFVLLGPGKHLKIGNDCSINHYVILNAASKIVIGNNVTLSASCQLHTAKLDISVWPKKRHINSDIIIGDNVWLASGVIINAGVSIKSNVIVGANSFIKNDLESGFFYAGNPAKKISKLNNIVI